MWVILFSDVLIKNKGEKEMINSAVLVCVRPTCFFEIEPGCFFLLLNEMPGYEGAEVVADKERFYAHLFFKLHCEKEQKNNTLSYKDHSLCHIDQNRKVIPIKIW